MSVASRRWFTVEKPDVPSGRRALGVEAYDIKRQQLTSPLLPRQVNGQVNANGLFGLVLAVSLTPNWSRFACCQEVTVMNFRSLRTSAD